MGLKIALFDYMVTPTNPAGGCHFRILQGLSDEHEFTVFAIQFENPAPDRIRWIRIPAPTRPLALVFLVYHILAPIYYLAYRFGRGQGFDLVQTIEGYISFGDVAYSHFGHRSFLRYHWKGSRRRGMRGVLRWLDHALRALVEPLVYRRISSVVVPSKGLQQELVHEFPRLQSCIHVIPNPVDIERMRRPASFDRIGLRASLGVVDDEILLVFVALGHFERKGLPELLTALATLKQSAPKLLIVGGETDLVASYHAYVGRLGLDKLVTLIGMQRDVRPYLWAADAFVFPSFYETFSLVTFEAAAAGLPPLVTQLHGVEEFLRDGENGILLETSARSIAAGIRRLVAMSRGELEKMGRQAQLGSQRYATSYFVDAWRCFYQAEIEKRQRPDSQEISDPEALSRASQRAGHASA